MSDYEVGLVHVQEDLDPGFEAGEESEVAKLSVKITQTAAPLRLRAKNISQRFFRRFRDIRASFGTLAPRP
jgi:hypothetical protein